MGVNLQKGQKVNLKKSDGQALSRIRIGLGWDPVEQKKGGLFGSIFGGSAPDIDCDASVIVCKGGRLSGKNDIVYFGNLKHSSGAIVHTGDNLTGEGEGDDEVLTIDFTKVPADVDKIAITVTIYEADVRKQNFGQVSNAYVRVARMANAQDMQGTEVLRFDLMEEFSVETALVVCEIYRHNGEWKFNAVGAGYQGGLEALCRAYGVNV